MRLRCSVQKSRMLIRLGIKKYARRKILMSDSSNHLRDTSFSGQDINNSIVNTGDYNSLILGNYESLDDALVEPGAVFDRVNLDHFSGRKWLLAQIDSFLQKNDRGYLIIEANAGLGKTSFLAWLVRERKYFHNFCELTPGPDGVKRGLRNLAAQLILAHKLSSDKITSAASRPDYFYRLLRRVSADRKSG